MFRLGQRFVLVWNMVILTVTPLVPGGNAQVHGV